MRKWNARSIGISTSMPEHERAKLELLDIDGEIAHLEALLELRNEQRRELVNYLGLNKCKPVGPANVDLRSVK